jgi:hypothetical protein
VLELVEYWNTWNTSWKAWNTTGIPGIQFLKRWEVGSADDDSQDSSALIL